MAESVGTGPSAVVEDDKGMSGLSLRFKRIYRIGFWPEPLSPRRITPVAARNKTPWTFLANVRKIRRFGRGLRGRVRRRLPIRFHPRRHRNAQFALDARACARRVRRCAGHSPRADRTLKKIKDSGTITIGHRDSSIPFSYYDDKQNVVGYSMDICMKIVDAVKAELKMPNLQVKLNPVTSATRIPLIANGTIDLECGSTTNNLEREKQVGFINTYFVTANRYVAEEIVEHQGPQRPEGQDGRVDVGHDQPQVADRGERQTESRHEHPDGEGSRRSFLMVETGRATAFFMDDILLYSLVARVQGAGRLRDRRRGPTQSSRTAR
jgi:hypothetical protein